MNDPQPGAVVLRLATAAAPAGSSAASPPEVAFRRRLGCRIRVTRMERGLSQRGLAELVDVPPATIRRMEDGVGPTDSWYLSRIAAVLDIGPSVLIGAGTDPGRD